MDPIEKFPDPHHYAGLEVVTLDCGIEPCFNRNSSSDTHHSILRQCEGPKRSDVTEDPVGERKRTHALSRTTLWLGIGLLVSLIIAIVATALGFTLAVKKMHELNTAYRSVLVGCFQNVADKILDN